MHEWLNNYAHEYPMGIPWCVFCICLGILLLINKKRS